MNEAPNQLQDVKLGDVKSLFLRFAIQHGPWAVLSSVLLAALFGWIPSPLSRQLDDMKLTILENRVMIGTLRVEFQNQQGYQNVLLRVICRNQLALQQQGLCEPKYYGYEEKTK